MPPVKPSRIFFPFEVIGRGSPGVKGWGFYADFGLAADRTPARAPARARGCGADGRGAACRGSAHRDARQERGRTWAGVAVPVRGSRGTLRRGSVGCEGPRPGQARAV